MKRKRKQWTAIGTAPQGRLTVEEVFDIVQKATGQPVSGKNTVSRSELMARYAAILMLNEEGYGVQEIAQKLGGMHRGTIYKVLRTCERHLDDHQYRIPLTLDLKAAYLASIREMAERELKGELQCA